MKFNSKSHVKMFTDMMNEGFIVIDSEGEIQIYNYKAKEIFGIRYGEQISHDKGNIDLGDIVIIADNDIGNDDGKLDSKSLEVLGIVDRDIQEGDALIAIGIYNKDRNEKIKTVYKVLKKENKEDKLTLETRFLEVDVEVEMDFTNREIIIRVNGQEFRMFYISAIGHMVILDKLTKEMKFYQSQGYTARNESINDILKGNNYRAKGKDTEALDVIGKHIFEIHKSASIIQQFSQVAEGENISYIDKFEEINGYPTICTLLPIENKGQRIGAVLKVEDISEIEKLTSERDSVIRELKKAEEQLLEEEVLNKAFPRFVGNSKQIQYVKRMALKASKTNSNVLILGASGTGKTILGKTIHENSKLKGMPFIHVNCGAIPENLLESELFGYEKGAFTGARSEGKKGFFELANGGTILLDEFGDIPQNLQVKLLQVIQEKKFYRVGGIDEIIVDVRIIAATNKNLEKEMLNGKFREDLYYRINVLPIWIPPLKERKEDINTLVNLLLPRICQEIDCENKRISSEAMNLILRYDWPGNVRELENILERAVNLTDGKNIMSNHIMLQFDKNKDMSKKVLSLKELLEEQEKIAIEEALLLHHGDKSEVMKTLDISKTTLYERLKRYNIK